MKAKTRTKVSDAPHEGRKARYYTKWSKTEEGVLVRLARRQPDANARSLANRATHELRALGFNRTICACEMRLTTVIRRLR